MALDSKISFFDSLPGGRRTFIAFLSFALLLTAAIVYRVYDIDLRLLHNDEGVNYHFIKETRNRGYYPYSHENYHGPAYFYLTRLMMYFFGDAEFGLRSSAILMGTVLLFVVFPLRRLDGVGVFLFGGLLAALSSSLVFYARYAIHENMFLFAGAGAGICLYAWHRTRFTRYVWLGFLFLGLLIATKETFIISLFCLFWSFLALGDYRAVLRDLFRQRQVIFAGGVLMALLMVLFFTGGLTWPGGLREMFLAVPQWVSRNTADVGHHKPFGYYLEVMRTTEPQLFLFPLLPIIHIGHFLKTPGPSLIFPVVFLCGLLGSAPSARNGLQNPDEQFGYWKTLGVWVGLTMIIGLAGVLWPQLGFGTARELLLPMGFYFALLFSFTRLKFFGDTAGDLALKIPWAAVPVIRQIGWLVLAAVCLVWSFSLLPFWSITVAAALVLIFFSHRETAESAGGFGVKAALLVLVMSSVFYVEGVTNWVIILGIIVFSYFLMTMILSLPDLLT